MVQSSQTGHTISGTHSTAAANIITEERKYKRLLVKTSSISYSVTIVITVIIIIIIIVIITITIIIFSILQSIIFKSLGIFKSLILIECIIYHY